MRCFEEDVLRFQVPAASKGGERVSAPRVPASAGAGAAGATPAAGCRHHLWMMRWLCKVASALRSGAMMYLATACSSLRMPGRRR